MQACRRRGGGTRFTRIDRLIAFRVIQLFMDIWWQWDIAYLRKERFDWFSKSNKSFCAIQHLNDFCLWSIFDLYLSGYAYTFSTDQTLPGQFIFAAQKKQFDASACGVARINPGRDDARLIQHQQIIGMKIFSNLAKDFVLERSCITMEYK